MLLALVGAPLLVGWVNQCRAWLQSRSAPPLLQPYRTLAKLFRKEVVLAHNASPLFRATPYILFGCMWLAVGIVPMLATSLPFAPAADVIALVGLFALARAPRSTTMIGHGPFAMAARFRTSDELRIATNPALGSHVAA